MIAVNVGAVFINERLGLSLKSEQIEKLLTNVEFKVARQKDELEIIAPFWRTDIAIPEDIVEEVGRLYGYDHLPLELPKRDLSPTKKDKTLDFKQRLRGIMSAAGANEVLTYSFVHGSLLAKVGQSPKDAYKLRNALSPDLQYYRLSVTPSLLDKVQPNIKQGHDKFVLFELGKAHNKLHPSGGEEKVPKEFDTLAAVFAGKDSSVPETSGASMYQIRAFLDNVANHLGVSFVYAPISDMPDMPITKPYDLSRSATVVIKETGAFVGMIGEFRHGVGVGFKLPKYCSGFEIGIGELLAGLPEGTNYKPLPKFPKVQQDITLSVASKVTYGELLAAFSQSLDGLKPINSFTELLPVSIYSKTEDQKNITWRLNIASYEKTMKAEEVNTLLDEVAGVLNNKFGAERV